ncbi:MAG: Mth938-like domain-containing protein [Chromatiales bacterium]|nr:Mth938-like domain-containing protein [Chromatiales bacterium]
MKLVLHVNDSGYQITGVDEAGIWINGKPHDEALVVSAERLQSPWAPQRVSDLTAAHLEPLMDWQPEIVLIGTGKRLAFPAQPLLRLFLRRNIGVEVMDTVAACRTYNVLMSEERRVVAALLPVSIDFG